jgi:glycosyltransferase involved in cell wall biosynthesis
MRNQTMALQHLPDLPDLGDLPAEPLVTVIISCYQHGHYIDAALESIRVQTHQRWECIVVDDGSTDDSAARVEVAALAENRIRLVRQTNGGQVSCFNAVTEMTAGDIVCFLDADDEALPDRIAQVITGFRADPTAGLLIHRLYAVDAKREVIGLVPLSTRLPSGDRRSDLLRSQSGLEGAGVTSGMAVRRAIFAALFPADPAIFYADEHIRRCAPLISAVASVEAPLGLRRIHGSNLTAGTGESIRNFVERHRSYSNAIRTAQVDFMRHHHLSFVTSGEGDTHLLASEFVLTRLSGSHYRAAHRNFTMSLAFGYLPHWRRFYWRVAGIAPRPVFVWMVRSATSPGGLKPVLNWIRFRKSEYADLDGSALRPATLRSILRRSLTDLW